MNYYSFMSTCEQMEAAYLEGVVSFLEVRATFVLLSY